MMLGLPSTTEVGKRLPKEAFYRNLDLDKRTKDEFVHLIDRITIENSVKPATANITDGKRVHEVLVLRIDLKGAQVPERAIEAVARSNPHELVFCIEPLGAVYAVHEGLWSSESLEELRITGPDMDAAWAAMLSQIAFGTDDPRDIDARLADAKRRAQLEAEIAALDAKCRKTKQINKRNELFRQLKAKERELSHMGTRSTAHTVSDANRSKALSFQEPYAMMIAVGAKTVECRSRKATVPIKNLVVCASKTASLFYPIPGLPYGYAIGLVDVVDCVPFEKKHLDAAMMTSMPKDGSYAWVLQNARMIEPFKVHASASFFYVDDKAVEVPTMLESYQKHILPIAQKPDEGDDSIEFIEEAFFKNNDLLKSAFEL